MSNLDIRIQPVKMAEIYFNRMHFSSLIAVTHLLKEYRGCVKTALYWREVLSHLEQKSQTRGKANG